MQAVCKRVPFTLFLSVFLMMCGGDGTSLFGQTAPLEEEKINLALRRMADQLLRASGDSVSRIPAIERSGEFSWKILMEQRFEYDSLPGALQEAVVRYDIEATYQVAVKRCDNHKLDLGFFQKDFVQDSTVPCMGREEPEGCHYIEVTFMPYATRKTFWASTSLLLLLTLVTGSGALIWYRKSEPPLDPSSSSEEQGWIVFGQSKINMSGQWLECGGQRVSLTYREAKLLKLLASHPDQVLERDFILNEVWGDEGIQVSRSIDMFISRLRKKLSPDPTISIVAVHGVGYRMETRVE